MVKNVHILLASLAALATGVDGQCDGTEPQKWYASGNFGNWAEGYCRFEQGCGSNYGPGYSTQLECCKGAFGGQPSGKCLSELESPPTTSPTNPGGLADFW